jgi:hypothetical protein
MTLDALTPAQLTTLIEALSRRPAQFRRLKAAIRAVTPPGPPRWYRNPHGRQRWHVTGRPDVHPELALWAACGAPVFLDGPARAAPPVDALVCQRCRRSRLARGVIRLPSPAARAALEALVGTLLEEGATIPSQDETHGDHPAPR